MPKLKIDFIISKMSSGGAERVVANLANYFSEKKYIVRVITFNPGDHYQLNEDIHRIRLHKKRIIHSTIPNGFLSLLKFYRKKSNRPDVISSHIGMLGFITIPASLLYNIKIIVSEHFNHKHQPVGKLKKILWNNLYKYANALTILTKYDYDFFSSRNKNVVVMENPCSFDSIKTETERTNVILAVGNLNRYKHKGFDNLIEIASKILPNNPSWEIKIVGSGNEGNSVLQKLIEEYKLESQIKLLGFRDDVKELMANSKIFMLTSRNEGLPMVLLEAMSQGMACISYDCISGPSDIIVDNYNGLLIKDQDKSAMENGLSNLIENKELQTALMKNAPNTLNKFSIEIVGKKWENLIENIS